MEDMIMKKKYMKPDMRVVPLRHRTMLLTGSGEKRVNRMSSNLGEDAIYYGGEGDIDAR